MTTWCETARDVSSTYRAIRWLGQTTGGLVAGPAGRGAAAASRELALRLKLSSLGVFRTRCLLPDNGRV
jgi:hypothetical protein